MKEIKAIIFDVDGLMFDTENLRMESYKYAMPIAGITVSEQALIKTLGVNSKEIKRIMFEDAGYEFDYGKLREIRYKYVDDYMEKYGAPIKKGLYELISFINNIGLKKAIATSNSYEVISKYCKEANLLDEFEIIVTGDKFTRGKPFPDIFLNTSEQLGIPPEECMVLEDSFNGIKAAHSANMLPVMVPDIVKPDEKIEKLLYAKCDSLLDVIEIIRKAPSANSTHALHGAKYR